MDDIEDMLNDKYVNYGDYAQALHTYDGIINDLPIELQKLKTRYDHYKIVHGSNDQKTTMLKKLIDSLEVLFHQYKEDCGADLDVLNKRLDNDFEVQHSFITDLEDSYDETYDSGSSTMTLN